MKPGVKKQSLEEKVQVAWFKATSKDPDLSLKHGNDGWTVFKKNMGKRSIEGLADLFNVSFQTAYRWSKEAKNGQ